MPSQTNAYLKIRMLNRAFMEANKEIQVEPLGRNIPRVTFRPG